MLCYLFYNRYRAKQFPGIEGDSDEESGTFYEEVIEL